MKRSDIPVLRLQNQHLTKSYFQEPADAVRWLGAVQSQEFPTAKWGVGLRMENAIHKDIEDAFNKGEILRTHVLRPTWHFVMPEDIRWMLELTGPRVKKILAPYDRKLEITPKLISRCNDIFTRVLEGGKNLTRKELADHLERKKIIARGQRLAHIVVQSELDGIVCSGPCKGKQLTYALIEERVSRKVKKLSRDEALAKLALKYFTSHGPAQLKDFSWWSALPARDATEALDLVQSELVCEEIEGKKYWMANHRNDFSKPRENESRAFLLSIYDEYTIAYKDRSALGGEKYVEKMLSMGNALTAVIILDGKIVGTWKRIVKKGSVEVQTGLFKKLNKSEQGAIAKAARRYCEFLQMNVLSR